MRKTIGFYRFRDGTKAPRRPLTTGAEETFASPGHRRRKKKIHNRATKSSKTEIKRPRNDKKHPELEALYSKDKKKQQKRKSSRINFNIDQPISITSKFSMSETSSNWHRKTQLQGFRESSEHFFFRRSIPNLRPYNKKFKLQKASKGQKTRNVWNMHSTVEPETTWKSKKVPKNRNMKTWYESNIYRQSDDIKKKLVEIENDKVPIPSFFLRGRKNKKISQKTDFSKLRKSSLTKMTKGTKGLETNDFEAPETMSRYFFTGSEEFFAKKGKFKTTLFEHTYQTGMSLYPQRHHEEFRKAKLGKKSYPNMKKMEYFRNYRFETEVCKMRSKRAQRVRSHSLATAPDLQRIKNPRCHVNDKEVNERKRGYSMQKIKQLLHYDITKMRFPPQDREEIFADIFFFKKTETTAKFASWLAGYLLDYSDKELEGLLVGKRFFEEIPDTAEKLMSLNHPREVLMSNDSEKFKKVRLEYSRRDRTLKVSKSPQLGDLLSLVSTSSAHNDPDLVYFRKFLKKKFFDLVKGMSFTPMEMSVMKHKKPKSLKLRIMRDIYAPLLLIFMKRKKQFLARIRAYARLGGIHSLGDMAIDEQHKGQEYQFEEVNFPKYFGRSYPMVSEPPRIKGIIGTGIAKEDNELVTDGFFAKMEQRIREYQARELGIIPTDVSGVTLDESCEDDLKEG